MGKFKLSNDTIEILRKAGQEKCNQLANEVTELLTDKYIALLDYYYVDYIPKLDNKGTPYYIRSFNLYNSFKPYKRNSHNTVYYGGIEITSNKMKDYDSRKEENGFSAQSLLDTFIYNSKGTWHGGDWHGGYGVTNSFSIYKEMDKYYKELLKKYSKEG